MRIKKWENLLVIMLAIIFTAQLQINAQQTQQPAQPKQQVQKSEPATDSSKKPHPRDEYSPANRPEENYLARFDAIKVSEKLTKQNLENIYTLKVIITNFPEQGWKGEYDQIYEQYKKGVSMFYRRQVIYSRVELEKNRQAIKDLFQKIAQVYRSQADDMLEKCADQILDYSLDEKNQFDPNRNKILFDNMMRLWIAYGQIDDAERAIRDKQFKSAVYHLRTTKAYAIKILETLDPENSKDKYEVHKADNLHRVAASRE